MNHEVSADHLVSTIDRREGEQLRITYAEFKGRQYVHFRVYFLSDVDGEWHPTRAGVTIAADRFHEIESAVAEVRKLIDAAPKKRPDRYERYARERST